MQTKNDVDRLLMDSFKELSLKTPIEKITIKEITDKAGVIRPTFYNHFQDKYEVIERIIQMDITDPVKVLLKNDMVTEAITLMFTNLLKDKEFFIKLSRLEGQNSFESITKQCIKELLMEFIVETCEKPKAKIDWLTPDHLSEYYAQSLSFFVITWVQGGMTATPREMAELYDYIMSHSMTDTIHDL